MSSSMPIRPVSISIWIVMELRTTLVSLSTPKGLLDDLQVIMESLDARIDALRKSIKAMRQDTLSLQQRIQNLMRG